jgi:hypothetical protein
MPMKELGILFLNWLPKGDKMDFISIRWMPYGISAMRKRALCYHPKHQGIRLLRRDYGNGWDWDEDLSNDGKL